MVTTEMWSCCALETGWQVRISVSVLAQSNCDSDCVSYYNKTCDAHNPDCPGSFVCCYDEHNEDQGCMGILNYCTNGGSKCGQSECDN